MAAELRNYCSVYVKYCQYPKNELLFRENPAFFKNKGDSSRVSASKNVHYGRRLLCEKLVQTVVSDAIEISFASNR